MTTEGYRGRVLFRSSPQPVISCRLSMAVGPEAAKSVILASSWFCPESAVAIPQPAILANCSTGTGPLTPICQHLHRKIRDNLPLDN